MRYRAMTTAITAFMGVAAATLLAAMLSAATAQTSDADSSDAANAVELKGALTDKAEETEVAPPALDDASVEPTPEPEPALSPVAETGPFFFDDFGSELSEDWVVNSPNPDGFIVEDGTLLVVNNAIGGFATENAQNLIVLKRDLPEGDWDAHITFTGELKTGRDSVWFGLYKDPKNYLGAQYFTNKSCCGCSYAALANKKSANGTVTVFQTPVLGGDIGCGAWNPETLDQALALNETIPMRLTFSKRGRSYYGAIDIGQKTEDGQPVIHETHSLTSLRAPGDLAFTVGKFGDAAGEVLVNIDSVEIVSVSE